jgi:hypothetical protein
MTHSVEDLKPIKTIIFMDHGQITFGYDGQVFYTGTRSKGDSITVLNQAPYHEDV